MRVAAIVLAGLLAACGSESPSNASIDTGAALVQVPLSVTDITSVTVTVTAPDIDTIVAELAINDGVASGIIAGIPAGPTRTFTVDAYSDGVLVCTDTVIADVTAGARVAVNVVLQCDGEVVETGEAEITGEFNFPPVIASVVATPSSVAVGGTVSFSASASDPDGDALTYLWTATDGTFDDPTIPTPVWTAPAVDGTYTITIEVSDGVNTVSVTIAITVTP